MGISQMKRVLLLFFFRSREKSGYNYYTEKYNIKQTLTDYQTKDVVLTDLRKYIHATTNRLKIGQIVAFNDAEIWNPPFSF